MRKKGRGAQKNSQNKFDRLIKEREWTDDDIEEYEGQVKTEFQLIHPKTIVNKVKSPDVSMMYSMNAYQGCEHGCIYCYARNTHEYWGYSAGIDFESKIMIKRNAPILLESHLQNPHWTAYPISMSGNTDCYQPIERKERLTRKCLEVFWNYRHPVSIITKNALILRDIDILSQLASENLVHATISITSLNEDVRRKMEPRTASVKQKLKTIESLTKEGISTQLMMGPIIPGLNDHEIFDVAKAAADAGAVSMVFTMVRLNGQIGSLFLDWVVQAFPSKADKIISLIKQVHNGKLNDSRWGVRKRGEGKLATIIHRQIALAKARHMKGRSAPAYNLNLHEHYKSKQLNLFFNPIDDEKQK